MAHDYNIIDDDNRFIIDGDSRQITNLSDETLSIMQSDHRSETYVFQMPRYIEGHDMTLCDNVYIIYKNAGRGTSVSTRPVIVDRESIKDIAVDEEDENLIVFSWTINDHATQYAGTLVFQFKFECSGDNEGDPPKFKWHTEQYSFIEVRPGLDISGEVSTKYPKLLDEIDAELKEFEDKLDGRFLGLHIGPEPPTTGQVAWIDTDAEENSYGIVAKPGQVVAVESTDIYGSPLTYKAVDLPKIPEPDLNANEGEEGHVKGRTHYIDKKGVIHKLPNMFLDLDWIPNTIVQEGNVVCPEREVKFTSESAWFMNSSEQFVVDLGFEYNVYWNGVSYRCTALEYDEAPYLGNCNLFSSRMEDTGEPFCFGGSVGMNDRIVYVKKTTSTAETVKFEVVRAGTEEYEKMPDRYLPKNVVKSVNGAKPDENGNVEIENIGGSGERGTGILNVISTPSSYTTEVNGVTPTHRIPLSTVKSQSGIDTVLVGDTIRHNVVFYSVIAVDDTYVYCGAVHTTKGSKGDKGDTGAKGERGTGILNVTTSPSAYTTEVNGITTSYRIDLSTVKTESGVDNVLVGDTIRNSSAVYPVIAVDASYAYLGLRGSIRGANGSDYVLTDADKTEIAQQAAALVPGGGDYVLTDADKTEIAQQAAALVPGGGGLEPLIGTTDEITPSQVIEAVTQGRSVLIVHTDYDQGLGEAIFSNFTLSGTAAAFSSVVIAIGSDAGCLMLFGEAGGGWTFGLSMLALKPPIIQLQESQMVEGATIALPMDEYMLALQQCQTSGDSVIFHVARGDGSQTIIRALYASVPASGYPCTVKCFTSTDSLITFALVPQT